MSNVNVINKPVGRRKTGESATNWRDGEKIRDGLTGYLRLANTLAYRYYRWQLPTLEDRQQAAALAALEAQSKAEVEGDTLAEVTSVVRHCLYRQAQAYGYRMVNFRRADGKRTSGWASYEILFSQLSPAQTALLDLEAGLVIHTGGR